MTTEESHELAESIHIAGMFSEMVSSRLVSAIDRSMVACRVVLRRIKLLDAQVKVETLARLAAEAERDEARRMVCWLEGWLEELDIAGQRDQGQALSHKGERLAAKARGWLYLYDEPTDPG